MQYNLSSYQFDLPPDLIAQHPVTPRDQSRLMVIDRKTGEITHGKFRDILNYLDKEDQLVFNNTRVIPARLHGKKNTGAAIEVLLVEPLQNGVWLALTKPAKKVPIGTQIVFSDTLSCEVLEERAEGMRVLSFNYEGDFDQVLVQHGEMPLPPYIQRPNQISEDSERYQTVYASQNGAVAAPTAGLHFTEELLKELEHKGVERTEVTLHVGIGTFRPVSQEDIRHHPMHEERYHVSFEAAAALNLPHRRRICVGTTSCRTLESAALADGTIIPGMGRTDIYIFPGYTFKKMDALLTNFHLPGSTLLMLVAAFSGYELAMSAYRMAIKEKYRFFSFGDAMLIL